MDKKEKYYRYVINNLLDRVDYDEKYGDPHFNIKEKEIVFGDTSTPVSYFFGINHGAVEQNDYPHIKPPKEFKDYILNKYGVSNDEVGDMWETFATAVVDNSNQIYRDHPDSYDDDEDNYDDTYDQFYN
tara:strand:- start:310 stop:696 length:387 start_codon:yes stop_codon:yes gene_type:complete